MKFSISFMKATIVSVLATTFASQATADILYRLTDLGNLVQERGGADSRALGINNSGDVVGWAYADWDENSHAYQYSTGRMQDIHPNNLGYRSAAYGLSENGLAAGLTVDYSHHARATVWRDGVAEFIGPRNAESLALDINDSGGMTGNVKVNENWHAFRHDTGGFSDLGTLGGSFSYGLAINSAGTIVGHSLTASPGWQQHAFSCGVDGVMRDLGTLGGEHSQANGINDLGQIVGSAWQENDHPEAFIYSLDHGGSGLMQSLGVLGGFSSGANDINENGDVVGWWSPDGFSRLAFVSFDNHPGSPGSLGEMLDLNNLIDPATGWTLVETRAINDFGAIVGFGIDPNGIDRGFLLTPIPAPNTTAVFSVFISTLVLGLGLRRRR